MPADLTGQGACAAVVERVAAELGGLDVLVCSAGYQHIDAIAEFPEDRWRDMLALMLTAPFLLTKHAWPFLTRGPHGRIVHVGSAHSLGTWDNLDFAARYPACVCPCQRFGRALTAVPA